MKLTEIQRREMLGNFMLNGSYAPTPIRPLAWALAALGRLSGHWQRTRDRQTAIAQLSKLSPALLSDIGLEHSDIERAVDAVMASRAIDDPAAAQVRTVPVTTGLVCRA